MAHTIRRNIQFTPATAEVLRAQIAQRQSDIQELTADSVNSAYSAGYRNACAKQVKHEQRIIRILKKALKEV